MEAEWRQLGRTFKKNPDILITTLNCTGAGDVPTDEGTTLCQAYGVEELPKISAFSVGEDGRKAVEYFGNKRGDAFYAYARDHLLSGAGGAALHPPQFLLGSPA